MLLYFHFHLHQSQTETPQTPQHLTEHKNGEGADTKFREGMKKTHNACVRKITDEKRRKSAEEQR